MSPRKKHKIFSMTPNLDKIREAILCVLAEGKKKKFSLTQYDIVKAIFFADRAHLNKYARPITFDNYVAMIHGPVPSLIYDILKDDEKALRKIGGRLWQRTHAPQIGNKCYEFKAPERDPNLDILSESDVEELKAGLTIVKSLGFSQIRKLTHEDPAYLDAWEDESGRRQFDMSYALLFDSENDEMAEQISFASGHI